MNVYKIIAIGDKGEWGKNFIAFDEFSFLLQTSYDTLYRRTGEQIMEVDVNDKFYHDSACDTIFPGTPYSFILEEQNHPENKVYIPFGYMRGHHFLYGEGDAPREFLFDTIPVPLTLKGIMHLEAWKSYKRNQKKRFLKRIS